MRDERKRAGGLAVACRGLLLQIFHKKRFPCNLFLANFLRSYGESCRKWGSALPAAAANVVGNAFVDSLGLPLAS
ncbi:hypothetical protein BDL97_06G011100 [Sphagnum fallax]|nr:hypothetical protein BDL97_06G011100 [Sphagnum fallax]